MQCSAVSSLTPRDIQLMELISFGMTTARMADYLGLMPMSVDNHVRKIFLKLGLDPATA